MLIYVNDFLQDILLKYNLSANDALLLSYLNRFFSSGKAKNISINNEIYYYITYKKICGDIPVLSWKERSIRNKFYYYLKIGILKKVKIDNKLFININWQKLANSKENLLQIKPVYESFF